MKKALFLLSLFAACTFSSCTKGYFELDKVSKIDWDPSVAIPLVYTDLSIIEVLTKVDTFGLINVGSDKFCTLLYDGRLLSLEGKDLVSLPNQTQNDTLRITAAQAAILNSAGTLTVNFSEVVDFDAGGSTVEIDSLMLAAGSMLQNFSSSFKHNIQLGISIPSMKKQGGSFTSTVNLNYTSSIPVIATFNEDLSGYQVDMTDGGISFNKIRVDFVLTITKSANPVVGNEEIVFSSSMDNLLFGTIYGYIGQVSLSPKPDTVKLTIFHSSLLGGSFSIVDPSIKFITSNAFGLPVNATATTLEGHTFGVGSYPLMGSGIPNPLPIKSPGLSQYGQVLVDSFRLNNSNSNISNVIHSQPKQFIYEINSLSNPTGNTTKNFLIDTSRFVVDMEVTLPLFGRASNFLIEDTLEFILNKEKLDNYENVLFRTHFVNGFPIEADMQVFFVDAAFNRLDSIIDQNSNPVLPPSGIDLTTGRVSSPSSKVIDVTFDESRISNVLKKTEKVIVRSKVSTAHNQTTDLKIYADYVLTVEMGAMTKLKDFANKQ